MTTTLFERIGGKDAVTATVVRLYEKILADETLAPFFEGVDMSALRRSQIAFVTLAFGGFNNYSGKNLRSAHAGLVKQGLNDKHFNAVATHLSNAMKELGVNDDLIKEALSIVETTRNDVLGKDVS